MDEYRLYRAINESEIPPDDNDFYLINSDKTNKFYFKDIAVSRSEFQMVYFHYRIKSYSNGSYVDETNSMYIIEAGIDWNNALYLTEKDNHIHLAWGPHPTFTATNYKIYRAICPNPVSPRFRNYQLIYTTSSSTFSYTDYETYLQESDYYIYYYVKAYNSNNSSYSSPTNVVERYSGYNPSKRSLNSVKTDLAFRLNQNYPNPFNPSTEIRYAIPRENHVLLKVYDTFGREIAVLVNKRQDAGTYTVNFNGKKLASGVYFYEIVAGEFRDVRKMLLVK